MMNSYRQNDGRRALVVATIAVLLLFGIDLLSGGAIRHVVRRIAANLSADLGSVSTSIGQSGLFSSRASLAAQNATLSEEVTQLQTRAALTAILQAENDNLRVLIHLAGTVQGISAHVTSSVISSPYGTFLIAAGSADGIRTGDLVMAADASSQNGFLVGAVSDVSSHTSTVREFFAPGASVDGVVASAPLVLTGSGGGNAHATVPRGTPIAEGEAVFAPEYGARALGIVGAVASSSASATEDVYVNLPINLGALQFVYVITS